MIRQVLGVILVLTLLVGTLSCSSTQNATPSSDTESLKQQITQLQQRVAQLEKEKEELRKSQAPSKASSGATVAIASPTVTPTRAAESESITIGQTVTIPDVCEFTVTKTMFTDKVMPPNPASFYTYYQVKTSGHTYLDVVIAYKNLEGAGKRADEAATVSVLYNDKYKYTSFSTIEEDGGSNFTYTSITDIPPLTTGVLHFVCEVPVEVKNSGLPVVAIITVQGQSYRLKVV